MEQRDKFIDWNSLLFFGEHMPLLGVAGTSDVRTILLGITKSDFIYMKAGHPLIGKLEKVTGQKNLSLVLFLVENEEQGKEVLGKLMKTIELPKGASSEDVTLTLDGAFDDDKTN